MKNDPFHKLSQKYNTPNKVQSYLNTLNYNKDATMYSALTAIKLHKAHCLEGVFVAAAILERNGYEPYVLSLESQDKLDHCLFVYQAKGLWGSIGKSRDRGLGGRVPKYKTLAQLVNSYFDPYIDKTGKITAWQIAHLDEISSDWRCSPKNVWVLENHLLEIKHHQFTSTKSRYARLLKRYLEKGDLPLHKNWR